MNTNHQKNIMKFNKTIITYSWSKEPEISHRISGHLFEAIDYFLDNRNIKILLPEINELRINQCIKAIKYKYKQELLPIIFDSIVFGRPKLFICNNLILCDGIPPASEIITNKLELWLCGKDFWWVTKNRLVNNTFNTLKLNFKKEIYQNYLDNLINKIQELKKYSKKSFNLDIDNSFIKKINIEYYKTNFIFENNILIYGTGNCRSLSELENIDLQIKDIIESIKLILKKHKCNQILLIGINKKDQKFIDLFSCFFKELNIDLKIILEDDLPIENFHEKFNIYLYTPTAKNWDCSSRLIRECKEYNKNIYFTNFVKEKLSENYGLKYLIDELNIKENDEI